MTTEEEILKNEIEGLLIDLSDNGYKIDVTFEELLVNKSKSITSIKISNTIKKDISNIKDYINTLHDFMTIKDSKMVSIDILCSNFKKMEVELLEGPNKFSKLKGKKNLDFEKIWDSIDYSIFISNGEIGEVLSIAIKYF